MLVEKKTQDSVVVAIKLVTGEEVIARKISDDDQHIIVSRPLAMVMAENPDNPTQTRVMFTPWMVASGKEVVTIKNAHVVAVTPARDDAADQYEHAIAG
jgi:hypothetical protein